MPGEGAVEIEGLTHAFETRIVLRDINLRVGPGELMAIMGSSGGGKTTLLRCVSGLIVPTQGTVRVDGVDVRRQPEEARRRMGMVFQSAALFDFMTVEDNLLFGVARTTDLGHVARRKVVAEALDRVGLAAADARKMPAELSGGMRKRVGVARALALQPRIMLYDEPTTGLDPITTYTLDELMASLSRELGVTALLVSHDVSSVMRVAHRVAFLHQGQLAFEGTPAAFESADHPAIRELVRKSQSTAFLSDE